MIVQDTLPRILIIDDLFGRVVPDGANWERANLCGQFLLKDVTADEDGKKAGLRIKKPVAEAVFFRGQNPRCASVGDTVENDLPGTLEFVRQGWEGTPHWSLVLLDLCFYTGLVTAESNRDLPGLPEGASDDSSPSHYFGLTLLKAINDEFPDLPVIILSSQAREQVSHEFSTRGALGFLARSDPKCVELLQDYILRHGLIEDPSRRIIGRSKGLLLALRAARRTALNRRQTHVLLRGERGVGKELFARYITAQVPSQEQAPFVIVNSAVLTPELFASELFGINRRVATQVDQRDGLIKSADGGDLFFDEIKDMVPQVQAGILRVLEDGSITAVGGREAIPVDVRFLSATNSDIESLAAAGRFRNDLLDRLRAGGTLVLPPLRERKEDIPALTEEFVRRAEQTVPGALYREIDPSVIENLCQYDWPGNVRQLRNCVYQAVRAHPDLEHLVPVHLDIPQDDERAVEPNAAASKAALARLAKAGQSTANKPSSLDDLVELISDYEFDPSDSAALFGKLDQLETASSMLLANYLLAVLTATKRPTVDHPEGEIFIHPAVKLMTGDSTVSASTAADLIKRILSRQPTAVEQLMANPLLKEAFETARRLRPSNPKKKRAQT